MNLTLHYTPGTRAIRPRWLLEELDVNYDLSVVDLFNGGGNTPEYKTVHPLGQVPALEIDGQIQLESGAMCQWLADHFTDAGLAPAVNTPSRISYEQWMFFAPGTLEPPAWLILMHTRILPESQRITAIEPWATERYKAAASLLEEVMKEKNYLLGDSFTAADIMVGSTLMWLPEILNHYPVLHSYVNRLQQRQAFIQASQKT